jgi:hypothetical protein
MPELHYDPKAKIYYLPHDGETYEYYCPRCHLEHYPWSDDEWRPWDITAAFIENGRQTLTYEYRELMKNKQLDWRLENGYCLRCGEDAPWMAVSIAHCNKLGIDYRYSDRPALPPEEMKKLKEMNEKRRVKCQV